MCFNISTDIILWLTAVLKRRAAAICQRNDIVYGDVETEQSYKKGRSPGCCLAWCETIYFVRWLHDVTSRIIAVRTSGRPARPQHVHLHIYLAPTVGLRLPALLTVQADVYTVSLHICLFVCLLARLQLKATVPNVIAVTESAPAFISQLTTSNNSIKRSQSCEDWRHSGNLPFLRKMKAIFIYMSYFEI